ncbi:MAG: LysR family transcriptional regulator [Paracoccaceae bacterium]|jgi:DNA-binding transcriptional LysR family regulator|nr:LysR family transcriptional regulator [Paracoccaceae bacterium]
MRINYDFGDLETFLAVMETGSFHVAAEQMNLSQPAVTRRIAKLEQALDSVLFERTTRAVKPTLAAKRLRPRAEAILQDIQETNHAMRDESVAFEYQRNAIVTVATIPTVLACLFLPAMQSFRNRGFHSRIRLLDLSANDVAEAVASGEADFGICSIPTLEPGTEFEALFEDAIMMVCLPDHLRSENGGVRWSDIANQPLILPARGTGNRLLIDDAMARVRKPLNWTYEVGRTTTALELVADRAGIALLPRSVAFSHAASGLVFQKMEAPEITRPIGLLSRAGQAETEAVSALKHALRQSVPW